MRLINKYKTGESGEEYARENKGKKRHKEKGSLLEKSNRTKTSDVKGTLRNTHMKKTLRKI